MNLKGQLKFHLSHSNQNSGIEELRFNEIGSIPFHFEVKSITTKLGCSCYALNGD
jgi:hypothetical protein